MVSKGVDESKLRSHGVSGYHTEGSVLITNEMIKFKNSGVLPELERYLNEDTTACEKSLKDVLYNIPFIHRAYCLTNIAQQNAELFIPIQNPIFVKKEGSREAWFQCELEEKYNNKHTFNKLPDKFEVDKGRKDKCIIRYKDRFKWGTHDSKAFRIQQLTRYHKKVRKKLYHIYSHNKLWYIKRKGVDTAIDKSTMTLCFVAMHRLSELSRYQPRRLQSHLNSQNSWLITEFVEKSLQQFVDEISSEITGDDFRVTGFRT